MNRKYLSDPLLMVIDMQNVYASGNPWACCSFRQAADNILRLVQTVRSVNNNVLLTEFIAPAEPFGVWQDYNEINREINENAYLNELAPELASYCREYTVYGKSTYSSLKNEYVRSAAGKASCVIVTGCVAECCVLSTIMELIDEGCYVLYITDACAGIDPEHEQAVKLILEELAEPHLSVMTTAECCALFNESTCVIAPTGAFAADESSSAAGFSVTGTLALCSVSSETVIRDLGVTSADLSMNCGDQYLSFVFQLENGSSSAQKLTDVHCVIDGSVRGDWGNIELAAGARMNLHVYNCNMIKLDPGLHLIQLYANGEQRDLRYFSLNDDWSSLMRRPSEEAAAAYDRTAAERSPYASLYMGFDNNTFSEVSVDFKADDQPDYTYVCPVSWWMDTSCIADQYRTIDRSRAAYCGFQTTEHGKIAIMSIWDTAYTDKNGNSGLIKATLTYHKPGTEYLKVAEGDEQGEYTSSHASCLLSYDWKEGHWYRTVLQSGTSESTGNRTISFWVCDLENNTWELLMVFDLGVKDTHITWFASFLECFDPAAAGEVRTMELANMRAYNYTNGTWEDPDYIYCQPGGCLHPELGGSGSCQVGCDGYTFRVITSGISGLSDKETDTSRFSIQSRDTVPPYGLRQHQR